MRILFCLCALFLAWAGESAAVQLAPLIRGLKEPVYVTVAPGEPGTLYVVEQRGRILAVDRRSGQKSTFFDIRG